MGQDLLESRACYGLFINYSCCRQFLNMCFFKNYVLYQGKFAVTIIAFQYIFLYECFERIQEEKQWRHKIMNDRAASGSSEGGGSASK